MLQLSDISACMYRTIDQSSQNDRLVGFADRENSFIYSYCGKATEIKHIHLGALNDPKMTLNITM